MLTYPQALALAEAWVRITLGDRARIDKDRVMKRPYGWVFFYQSVAFLETKESLEMLGGNAPIIVDRIDGELRVTGTARPVEDYLAAYEATLPNARLKMRLPDEPLGRRR